MALNRSAKSRILRRYFPGMTRNSEMSTEPNHHIQDRTESEGRLTAVLFVQEGATNCAKGAAP